MRALLVGSCCLSLLAIVATPIVIAQKKQFDELHPEESGISCKEQVDYEVDDLRKRVCRYQSLLSMSINFLSGNYQRALAIWIQDTKMLVRNLNSSGQPDRPAGSTQDLLENLELWLLFESTNPEIVKTYCKRAKGIFSTNAVEQAVDHLRVTFDGKTSQFYTLNEFLHCQSIGHGLKQACPLVRSDNVQTILDELTIEIEEARVQRSISEDAYREARRSVIIVNAAVIWNASIVCLD